MAKKIVFKGEKREFQLYSYEVGRFGGGTQPAEYRDKDGNIVPYDKTKWFQKKLKNLINGKR